jgi:hypothetical protein
LKILQGYCKQGRWVRIFGPSYVVARADTVIWPWRLFKTGGNMEWITNPGAWMAFPIGVEMLDIRLKTNLFPILENRDHNGF